MVNKIKKSALKRFLKIALLVILALLVAGVVFTTLRYKPFLKEKIAKTIYHKTNKTYWFSASDIQPNLLKRSITIEKPLLEPATGHEADTTLRVNKLGAKTLSLSKISIFPLLFKGDFVAAKLSIDKPLIEIKTNEDAGFNQINFQPVKMGDSLKIPGLNKLFIDSVVISNARLNIDTLFKSGDKITSSKLVLTQLSAGGIKQTETPFPFDVNDISINIENLKENLPDNIHRIYAGEISLSLLHSKLSIRRFDLTPVKSNAITLDNQYTVSVPAIEIESENIEQLYQSDSLVIKSVRMDNPTIQIKFGNKVEKGTPLNEINFYPLLKDKFRWLAINHFVIHNADLKMTPPNAEKAEQHIENLFIKFFDFNLDSTSYKNPELILSAKDLNISMERFTLLHNDKIHRFVIEKLQADTRDQDVSTGQLAFEPVKRTGIPDDMTILEILCEGVSLRNVDFKAFYHKKILPMESLVIKAPDANINFHEKKIVKSRKRDFSIVLAKINDYLKGIYVDKTQIERGYLHYSYSSLDKTSGFFNTNFTFELDNLSLDNATFYKSDKIFFADHFKASFSNLGLQLADDFHRLLADSVYISSRNRNAEIIDFRISPIRTTGFSDSTTQIKQAGIYDVHFPTIRLIGADLHKAFFKKELYVAGIDIQSPYLNIETMSDKAKKSTSPDISKTDIYSLIEDYLYKIDIKSLRMNDGNLNFTQYRKGESPIEFSDFFDITMTGFSLDSVSNKRTNKILYSDDIDLVLKNQSFTLGDGVHRLSADEIAILTSSDKIYLNNARLYPDVLSAKFIKMPVAFSCNIPSVEITGADINGLINNGNLFTNTITITKPDIQLLLQKTNDSIKTKSQQNEEIHKGIESIWAKNIVIDKGYIDIANYEDGKSKTFASAWFDVKLENLKADIISNKPAVKYTNLFLGLENALYDLPDNVHQISVGNATYDLGKMRFSFSGLDISPRRGIATNKPLSYMNFYFPEGSLTGFDVRKLIDDKTLTAFTLTLDNPDIRINDKTKKQGKKFDPYRLNLYDALQPTVDMIHINQIKLNNGNLSLGDENPLEAANVSVTANNFLINKFSDQKDKLFYCDAISFTMNYFRDRTKDSFYLYGVDKIFVTDKGDFKLSGISLTPAYPEAEFNRRKKYQDDCITINNADCTGEGLDIKQLITRGELAISVMKFNIDHVEIYRNNHYPIPENFVIEMPQKLLRDMKFKFGVDSINLACRKLSYRELEPHATEETKVHFTNIIANISNVTNLENKLKRDPVAKLAIDTKLMGFGAMTVKMDMNIADPRNLFDMKAECGKIPFYLLNGVTEPSLNLLLKDGYNSKMELYFEANNDSACGWMKFAYNDLMISILSENTGQKREQKFISFLANTLAVKRDNPTPGRIIKPVYFTVYPDRTKSIVNYCWLAAFEGIKKTLGMKDDTP
jgi:hypothetical protein